MSLVVINKTRLEDCRISAAVLDITKLKIKFGLFLTCESIDRHIDWYYDIPKQ